ncbi:MAG: 30S ribosomal protein S21 [bacterium]
MVIVRVGKDESIDRALRRFRKKCQHAGIIRDFKKSSHYVKPSEKRKTALDKSIRRQKRAMRLNHRS